MPSPRFHLPIRTRVACLATLALALITSRASTATAQDTSTRRDSASQTKQKQSQSKGTTAAKPAPKPKPVWPVKGPTPLPGSILPNKRIVAYYGNPLSKRMGILGELPPDEMLRKLDREVKAWERADSTTPVVPALHLIAVVAQGSAGRDGLYRARMADSLIERVYGWAQRQKAIMFLDIQVAKSTLQAELPRLTTFLSRPDVHLGLDPEFSMKRGGAPGKRIGTYDAADINYAIDFLADLVQKHNLPPKVLVIHRFTRPMVTNASKIKLDPRVQVVMHMDGWGPPWMKIDSYRSEEHTSELQSLAYLVCRLLLEKKK